MESHDWVAVPGCHMRAPMNGMLAGRRVLVVEDEMLILMDIEGMLADVGCESVTATTLGQAAALIDAGVFDLAMLDINLNGSNTDVLADKLSARGVPFVFSTGYSGDAVGENYRHLPLLKKPIRPADLIQTLSSLLSSPSCCCGDR
jgi:CheY-like chemotaxis protein